MLYQQAQIVAEYMVYLTDYIQEQSNPAKQIVQLKKIANDIKREELPHTREEFESQALLYHIIMDLEEFLKFKERFIQETDEEQRRR